MTDHQRALLNHGHAGRTIRVLKHGSDEGAVLVLDGSNPVSACRRSTFQSIRHRFSRIRITTIAEDFQIIGAA